MRVLFLTILSYLFCASNAYGQYWPSFEFTPPPSSQCAPNEIFIPFVGCYPNPNGPSPAASASTKFFVGTPTSNPNNVRLYSIDSQTIDEIILKVTGQNNVIQNLVEDNFQEVDNLERELADAITSALRDQPDIDQPGSVTVNAENFKLSISQTERMINVSISGIDASTIGLRSRKFCPFTCTRASGNIFLNDIVISTSYDFSDVSISNSSIDFNPTFNFRASGLLGALNRIFNVRDIDNMILDILSDGQSQFADTVNMEEFFNLVEFIDSLRVYANNITAVTNQIPRSLTIDPSTISPLLGDNDRLTLINPISETDIRNLVDLAVDEAIATVNGFGGLSVQIDLVLINGVNSGEQNMVGLFVSHVAPTIRPGAIGSRQTASSSIAPNTLSTVYFDQFGNRVNTNPLNRALVSVKAVSQSSLVSGLYSFPSNEIQISSPVIPTLHPDYYPGLR